MAHQQKSDSSSAGLTIEILIRGVLTLEQGEAKETLAAIQRGLERLVCSGEIPSTVAKEFRQKKSQELEKKIMRRVAIELMEMHSDPGYVASYGHQEAILVSAEVAAACGGDEAALWELQGRQISKEELEDVKTRSSSRGVCNYLWHSGTFDVPEGFVVVQRYHEYISTHGEYTRAWVVDEKSLAAYYEKLAATYAELAQSASAK